MRIECAVEVLARVGALHCGRGHGDRGGDVGIDAAECLWLWCCELLAAAVAVVGCDSVFGGAGTGTDLAVTAHREHVRVLRHAREEYFFPRAMSGDIAEAICVCAAKVSVRLWMSSRW